MAAATSFMIWSVFSTRSARSRRSRRCWDLLGTVAGIIHAFNAITASGLGDPRTLSGGIGEALITTAAGLTVAIPSLIAYRFLRSKVERLVIRMEKEAMKLVDALDERGGFARR